MRELGGVPPGGGAAVTARPLAAALALLIAGCAAHTAPPRTIEVPVAQPCLPAERIPAAPRFDRAALSGDAAHDLDLVTAYALRLKQWGEALDATLRACAGETVDPAA